MAKRSTRCSSGRTSRSSLRRIALSGTNLPSAEKPFFASPTAAFIARPASRLSAPKSCSNAGDSVAGVSMASKVSRSCVSSASLIAPTSRSPASAAIVSSIRSAASANGSKCSRTACSASCAPEPKDSPAARREPVRMDLRGLLDEFSERLVQLRRAELGEHLGGELRPAASPDSVSGVNGVAKGSSVSENSPGISNGCSVSRVISDAPVNGLSNSVADNPAHDSEDGVSASVHVVMGSSARFDENRTIRR